MRLARTTASHRPQGSLLGAFGVMSTTMKYIVRFFESDSSRSTPTPMTNRASARRIARARVESGYLGQSRADVVRVLDNGDEERVVSYHLTAKGTIQVSS